MAVVKTLCGPQSETRLIANVVSYMPTASDDIAPEQVLHRVNQLAQEDTYKFASRTAQAKFDIMKKVFCRIIDARPPEMDALLEDERLTPFVQQLKYFCRYKGDSAASTSSQPVLFGADAVMNIFEIVANQHAESNVNTECLKALKCFSWMLSSPEAAQRCQELIQKIDKERAPVIRMRGKSTPAASNKKKDAAVEEALAMFS